MQAGKIVLVASVIDQDDILEDFIGWHLHLGIDLMIVQDLGSRDGSRATLDRLAGDERVVWFAAPERDMRKYRPGIALATLARDKYRADWIILCDADEFLCSGGRELRAVLHDAESRQISSLNVPCRNMTGPVLGPGRRAIEALTVRIDRPIIETGEEQLSGELHVPYIFIRHPPHTIVRAAAFLTYGPGGHYAEVSSGGTEDSNELRFPALLRSRLRQVRCQDQERGGLVARQHASRAVVGLALAPLDSPDAGRASAPGLREPVRVAGARRTACA